MSLQITPLSPALGALVEGIDLSQSLSELHQHALNNALLNYQVLFFRNQPLTPQQHAKFASKFGSLHIHPIYPNISEQPEIMVLDTALNDLRDNAIWHTDVTFLAEPALGAVLAAKKVPTYGGDTLWASSSAAFEALSTPIKTLLDGLTATHDFTLSFPLERFGNSPDALARYRETQERHPPVVHPVIRTHPITGQKGLFVNEGFTLRINELTKTESDALLRFLFAHSTRPEFCIRWQWRANDVAFWDNRITQHYAVDDYRPHHRLMHRATIVGDKPF